MAKLPALSLFSRLYLTIVVAVIVSGTLTFFAFEKLNEQNDIDDYVTFTDFIYQRLIKQGKMPTTLPLDNINVEKNFLVDFSISWQIILEDKLPCDDCELLGHANDVSVYSNRYAQFFAVYKLPKVPAWLVISEDDVVLLLDEDNDSEYEEAVEDEDLSGYLMDDLAPLALLLIVLITIGSAIYWPIRAIQAQIENLIKTQQQFGLGDMNARAKAHFNKPLDELACSFNSMASSITETVNENQVFAQAVPHEVRTPLSRIQLAVGLLSRNNTNPEQLALLTNIDTYIGDINELISQVVAFSKLNADQGECEFSLYQSIELDDFIESRIKATKCEEKLTVIRRLIDSAEITTDPAYLRLLLDNLLKNACTHGKTKMIVSLQKVDNQITLSIEDDGEGIPSEHLETIFMPFSRLDVSRSRKTGGLGLGLSIAKAAGKRMNSELSVEDSTTAGAKFVCHFNC